MKFTLNWLKDYLETDASMDEIGAKLTAIGLEVESIVNPADSLRAFTVAEVLEAQPHPNADRLRVCKVNTGKETLQIVCGAPNARTGIKVALASVGTVIPTSGLKIKQSKIREVESCGMLCSADELGLGSDAAGIIELPADAKTGESIVGILGLDDPIIEIAITPNRADCTSVYGIARDLAAAGLGTLKPLKTVSWKGKGKSAINVTLNGDGCRQFVGCTIKGVKNGESPAWMQQRLKAIGLRPISALVDITNYITHDLGRPLHVYDITRLKGDITVTAGRGGQSFEALNDKEYTIDDDAVAITDDSGVIGLGGIIGGTSTGCEADTTDVFLEVAYFEPMRIAATGRALQIESDARYRFERGVDPAFLEEGARQAVQMIAELCGGEPSELLVVGKTPEWRREIPCRPARVAELGGMEIPDKKQKSILESLGFSVKANTAVPPSWRGDVEGEADLVEEILRIHGYEHIPTTLLPKPAALTGSLFTPMQQRALSVRKHLAMRGLTECVTWSFLAEDTAKRFGGGNRALKLLNPISSELDTMRPSLLPNLLEAATKNGDRGFDSRQLFEIGLQYESIDANGQQLAAAGIRSGRTVGKNPFKTERPQDTFDAKADALAVIEAAGFDPAQLQIVAEAPDWYHPGRCGALKLGKQVIGHFGELHPALLQQLDAPKRTVGFEIFLERIPLAKRKGTTKAALQVSDYQAVQRDFAFVVDRTLPANDLLRTIGGSDKKLIRDVQLFDVYEGEHVETGKKSVALSVTLQADDRTLSEQEIESVAKNVIASAEKLGAKLRA